MPSSRDTSGRFASPVDCRPHLCSGRGFRSDQGGVFPNDVVDDPLVGRERIKTLLFNLGTSITRCVQQNIVANLLPLFLRSAALAAVRRIPIAKPASPGPHLQRGRADRP